jgi:activator of HSP90 ATPase
MMRTVHSRGHFISRAGVAWAGLGLAASAVVAAESPARAAGGAHISRDSEEIHQIVDFAAGPARVYRALTTTEEFDKVVQLSAAMHSGMALGNAPTRIDAQPGGAFSLFGGYVTGRILELEPNVRIVEAWRSGSWPAGAYSIATLALAPLGMGTRLTFDHAGFPNSDAATLAKGWQENYWEPLAKSLA